MALAADSSARFAAEAMMRRRLWAFGVSVLVAACGEPEPEDEGLALSADCPALCSGLESVGQLVSLSALTYQASSHSTKLTRAGDGWAAVWSDEPPASYFQRFDAAGSIGSGFRIPDADGATQHWDGSSMAVWTYRDQTVVGPGRELSFARIGSGAQPPSSQRCPVRKTPRPPWRTICTARKSSPTGPRGSAPPCGNCGSFQASRSNSATNC
jgi:hypothetical protein